MIETTWRIPGAPRLALLGDFHNGDVAPILAALEKRRPEIVCVVGDMVSGRVPKEGLLVEEQANVLPFLRGCAAVAPTFLSLGNHEAALCEEDFAAMRATGVHLLDNAFASVALGGRRIVLCGVTSHYVLDSRAFRAKHPSRERYPHRERDTDWSPVRSPDLGFLAHRPEGYTILLSHHPEYYPLLPKADLVLSGHAHGGQWRVFGHGVFAPGQGWWPKWTRGVYEGRFVVTAGLTNTAGVPRFCNPTEVVFIEPR